MARKPTPWWWENESGWYVNHQGKRHFLGKHPEGAARPQKSKKTGRWNAPPAIEEEFRKLLGSQPPPAATGDSVVQILDDFISWCQENRAARTAQRYQDFCQDFVHASEGGIRFGALPITSLSSRQVTAWLNQRPTWGPTTKKNAITAIARGLNWAVKNRGLDRNPVRGMDKPEARRRSSIVTPEELEALLKKATGPFADLLTVSYDSGARPFEIKELERRHIDFDKQRAVIPADEAKGRRYPRTIYFPTARGMEILHRLCALHPTGPLFRNRLGNKWTAFAVKCAFARLEKVIGKRVKHYDLRRTFITRKIIAGVDSDVVAKLSGHQSTAMIDRHYSAVANDHEFMLKMAAQDLTPSPDSSTQSGTHAPREPAVRG
jgi:integrase